MFAYRVTKFDPNQRDVSGAFVPADWTSVSDVGRSIGGKTITKQQCLEIEDSYVEVVRRLLSVSRISSMRVKNLEVKSEGNDARFDDDGLAEICARLRDNTLVAGKDLEAVIRGCLREYIWCRLAGPRESYLHFGYDYYMYLGLLRSASAVAMPKGIFIEDVVSPYLSIDD
jgi:hypothetical protein